uniref:Tol-Pal system protein TolR n=1 Tax=Candidatus Kentrum eta TaxID=2126337 RepID=A0A450UKE3_9GAMM|nr:MAG: Cell division and transport-associated protein TolR (TC 2.C.1.2.1) [Candidatus Kentron sp. H]VFJ92977.1 MAG: Cell division and transport-associated protein TolR (TC 2.C.1.2.1) [Candidatus Kentron sp. H]VFJ99591.1 MAG: Cell division and transport-associated protein TolR (TC 2.C.1.2.1) [Candidatus Kentron sp. H]
MMVRYRPGKRQISDINIVPYIDVMLVLLVIFMITAPLLTQGIKVDLPQAPAEPLKREDREPLIVTIDAVGSLYLNYGRHQKRPIATDVLLHRVSALLRRHPDTPVLVRGDRAVPYGEVVTAMTLLQQAGAPSVGLVTELPERMGK